jgi:hypothetical protein
MWRDHAQLAGEKRLPALQALVRQCEEAGIRESKRLETARQRCVAAEKLASGKNLDLNDMRRLMHVCGDMEDSAALEVAKHVDALSRRLHSETNVLCVREIVEGLERCDLVVYSSELRRAKDMLQVESDLENAEDMDAAALEKALAIVEGRLTGQCCCFVCL